MPRAPAQPFRSSPGVAAYYPNCASARAAGAAPLRAGAPGYRAGLDRDGDGVACE
ncbi:excalibur calcium-binding domain-containing protein [Novosphingobium sp. HBC54]|uniref:Excalibur calcium-binding domain-containing protein n=2 Tax=Novosphingobium cyanobacteriorum TaxID=3024215 RepID=A0ABT6CPD2_9SPHN|nr:excalibur calcium-binding domain-containing protein [Novosphingobium cyanobacteriorum]